MALETEPLRQALLRKGFHAFNASWGVLLYHFLVPRWMAATAVGVITAMLGVGEFLRLRHPKIQQQYNQHKLFGAMLRPSESGRLSGAFYFGLGVFSALALFPKPAVEAACLAMGFGDAAAALVGRRWGTIKLVAGRSLQGSLTFLAVTWILVAAFRLLFYGDSWTVALQWGSLAGSAGALSEHISVWLDDNLTVPVLTSAALTLLLYTG
jgi:diacylglycerol kinase (CTP)